MRGGCGGAEPARQRGAAQRSFGWRRARVPGFLNGMTSPTRRAIGRWLEPFAASLWIFFLVWTALVALVWSLGIGEAEVLAWTERQFHLPPQETGPLGVSPATLSPLQAVLIGFLHWIDPVWAMMAAINVYAFTARREGIDVARRWAGLLLVAVIVVAWASAKTNWPMGPVRYTDRLAPLVIPNFHHSPATPERSLEWIGLRLGPVPLGLPLLWLAVILGARDLALRLRPSLGQWPLALAVGALGLCFAIALEPLAAKVRVFWLWPPGSVPLHLRAPVQSYATWFVVSAGLAFLLREKRVATFPQPARRSPAAVYVLLLAVLLLANLVTSSSR